MLLAAFCLTGTGLVAMPASSEAVIPTTNCGNLKVKGKKYAIKAHQTKCRFARSWSRKILKGSRAPKGWMLTRYKKGTSIKFVCRKAGKDFFAVRK